MATLGCQKESPSQCDVNAGKDQSQQLLGQPTHVLKKGAPIGAERSRWWKEHRRQCYDVQFPEQQSVSVFRTVYAVVRSTSARRRWFSARSSARPQLSPDLLPSGVSIIALGKRELGAMLVPIRKAETLISEQGIEAHDEVSRTVRVLEVTWDGSGNLPPFLGLTEALVASGHQVTALAHRTQKAALQAAGADVYSYASTGEFDSASSENRMTLARWLDFNRLAPDDVRAAIDRCGPDVLIIDCMMPDTLRQARSYARPVVSLVHSAWQIIRSVFDGVLRAPNEGVDLLVVTGYRGFHEGDAPPQMVWVGPLRATPKERPWQRRAHDRPLVLTSLSSGHQNQEETLRNVCAALSESPVEAIVTVGRGFDPGSIAAGANVYLERTVPHEHILGDASLLITHAGHGTAMMGLRFGVPMLCLPGVGDQPAVAERIVALGLGEMLDKTSSSKTIARAVTRLLADGGTRDRARAFARDAANHPGVELAIARIEALAARR